MTINKVIYNAVYNAGEVIRAEICYTVFAEVCTAVDDVVNDAVDDVVDIAVERSIYRIINNLND